MMSVFTWKPSSKGPSPAGGGGEDPGKRPGGEKPSGCGSDKTSDNEGSDYYDEHDDSEGSDYDDEHDDNSNNCSDNHNSGNDYIDNLDSDQVTKPRGPNIKYAAGSKPGELEQWEKDDISKASRKAASKRHQQTEKYKITKAKYKASSVGKRVTEESTERYKKSSLGQETMKTYRGTEQAKLSARKRSKKHYETHPEKVAEKIAKRSDDYKSKQSEANKKRYHENIVKSRLDNKEKAAKRRKMETPEQREARLAYLKEYHKKKKEEKKK